MSRQGEIPRSHEGGVWPSQGERNLAHDVAFFRDQSYRRTLVYAVKEDAESNIIRWKARWVAKGFRQRYGVDYFETYSGMVKTMIWQTILALVAKHDYEAHHVDITTALLESDLEERVYVQ